MPAGVGAPAGTSATSAGARGTPSGQGARGPHDAVAPAQAVGAFGAPLGTPPRTVSPGLRAAAAPAAPASADGAPLPSEQLVLLPAPIAPPVCTTRSANPPFTILSMTAGLPREFAACLRQNRQQYADRYGLEYCEFSAPFASASLNFCWQKLVAIQAVLRGLKRRAVLYIDADALIVNASRNLTALLEPWRSFEVLFAADYNGCEPHHPPRDAPGPAECTDPSWRPVSGGVIYLRNTPWARLLLDRLFTQGGKGRKPWSDSGMSDNREATKWARAHRDEFRRHAYVIPQNVMNSMRKTFEAGDLVFHMAGGSWSVNQTRASQAKKEQKYGALLPICRAHLDGADPAEQRAVHAALQAAARKQRSEQRPPWE